MRRSEATSGPMAKPSAAAVAGRHYLGHARSDHAGLPEAAERVSIAIEQASAAPADQPPDETSSDISPVDEFASGDISRSGRRGRLRDRNPATYL